MFTFQTAYTSVTRILREASQILEGGHYAAGHVRSVATRLETTWKDLATIFDERTTVLGEAFFTIFAFLWQHLVRFSLDSGWFLVGF